MFRKVLKYDFRAVGRIWWILAVSLLWISFIGAFALRFIISSIANDSFNLYSLSGIFFVFACIMAISASGLLSQLIVYYRFYRNFFTDEGYLTFTLPVSRKTLLLSKTVNAFIWTTLSGILIAVCFSMFFLISPPAEFAEEFYSSIFFDLVGEMFGEILDGWFVLYIIQALIIGACYMVFSISLIHFSITMGATVAKKYKLLAGVGIYYVANTAISVVAQIIGTFAMLSFDAVFEDFLETASATAQSIFIAVVLLIVMIAVAALAAVMYIMTQKRIENKLNLE
ncbi:MAG: hypothetical protein IJY08_01080 [Clostridia bacterium]|nr:hypothetical protein [Clostridia bacterium]